MKMVQRLNHPLNTNPDAMLENINFAHPYWLLLLLLLPLGGWYYYKTYRQRYVSMPMPSLEGLARVGSWRGRLRALLPLFRALAFVCLVVALARPQQSLREEQVTADGIDIALVIDLSSSMLAQDFNPNRLEVCKRVAADFVRKRSFDRIGLVAFAGEAFTQCPLTTDHSVVQMFLAGLDCGILEDGTAIGLGLATAVNRLKDSEAKSKVAILLTDGVNNTGYQSPALAAKIAREFGIKVYTIGVGSAGDALAPVSRRSDGRYIFGMARVEIDEALLREVATMTGGQYFRATDAESLERVYASIDQLEKTEIEVTTFRRYSEEYGRFVRWALLLIVLEVLLRYTLLRAIP